MGLPPAARRSIPVTEKDPRMLQKLLLQTIGAMTGAGLLGMIAVYLICGDIEG